jgi:hypothetical protein
MAEVALGADIDDGMALLRVVTQGLTGAHGVVFQLFSPARESGVGWTGMT